MKLWQYGFLIPALTGVLRRIHFGRKSNTKVKLKTIVKSGIIVKKGAMVKSGTIVKLKTINESSVRPFRLIQVPESIENQIK